MDKLTAEQLAEIKHAARHSMAIPSVTTLALIEEIRELRAQRELVIADSTWKMYLHDSKPGTYWHGVFKQASITLGLLDVKEVHHE